MTLSITVLSQEEEYLQFLNPNLCEIEETDEAQGLRTIKISYKFQDLKEDKQLFRLGNKIWIQGDENLTDTLYVINTSITEDIYKDNSFTFEAEEVLVELNYAPLFSQTELTTENGFQLSTNNGKVEVTINWNAINYWFGAYYNIGVVQDCLSEQAQKISLTGTMTRMSLLRQIEEETGNIFITRYEKDIYNNTIHRYLDFLNPTNTSKNWEYNLEYEFIVQDTTTHIYDENGNLTTDTYDDVEEEDDIVEFPPYTQPTNIDPTEIMFRFVDQDGELIDEDLTWNADEIGLEDQGQTAIISIYRDHNMLGVDIGVKNYAVASEEYAFEPTGEGIITISHDQDNQREFILPDNSYFEFYDYVNDKVLFRTEINSMIGTVHEEILDFGFNLENITYMVDETDTYQAISPVLTASEGDNGLTKDQMDTLINRWLNLEVKKGDVVPMIVQKQTITGTKTKPCVCRTCTPGTGQTNSATILGAKTVDTNYWAKPFNPSDNLEQTNKSYEYWRATAYWKAPFDKIAGEMYVQTNNNNNTQYMNILTRPDNRNERNHLQVHKKMGTVETSEEDIYNIFNAVCMKLKDKQYPKIDIDVDVANLRGHEYNNYRLHDLVYIKIPDVQELVTARVTKTTKEPHDIAKNKIEISNYTVGTVKTIQKETVINANNLSFPYPTKPTLTIELENVDHDERDEWSIQYPANKLLTITIFDENNKPYKVYTRRTNTQGKVNLALNLKPGDYDIEITYGGDEEYLETSLTIEANVYGTLETVETPKRATKSQTTTNNSNTTTKTVKTYWTKCGISPDKKQIVSIAQPSASNSDMKKYGVNYHTIYKTVFKNKCPYCGKATLRYDDGKKNGCITNHGHHGNKKEVPEGEITCHNCDSDFDGVTGLEKSNRHSGRLTFIKKPVKSSKTEKAKLIKGKLVYGSKKVTVKKKNKSSTKTRTSSAGINKTVRKKALSIVDNSTGTAAAKKIAKFMGSKIKYEKNRSKVTGFSRSPKNVLSAGMGNCCSQTRLLLQLLDAAGCQDTYKLQYVHVCCHYGGSYNGVGHVFAKLTHKKTGKYVYVDPCKDNPWGHYITGWGRPPGTVHNYSANSTPF